MTAISISPTNPAVALGFTVQLTATGSFSDGTSKDVTATLQWTSSTPAVAIVDNAPGKQGLASTVTSGITTIQATSGAISASSILTVLAPTLVSVSVVADTNYHYLYVGGILRFFATGHYSDGSQKDLSFLASWSTSDVSVATIDSQAQATGVALGHTLVSASYQGQSASATLNVSFAPVGSMSVPRIGHTATTLNDGRVLIAGGLNSETNVRCPTCLNNYLDSAEIYDPTTRKFTPVAPMSQPRYQAAAVLLSNGKVLISGGVFGEAPPPVGAFATSDRLELFDPVLNQFSLVPSTMLPRAGHVMVVLNDGRVLIAGGHCPSSCIQAWTSLYDPLTNLVTAGPQLIFFDVETADKLPDGKVLIMGGTLSELFDPVGNKLIGNVGSPAIPVARPSSSLPNGNIFLSALADSATTSEIYNFNTGFFTLTGPDSLVGLGRIAITLSNGQVVVTGGTPNVGNNGVTAGAELYDPHSNSFIPLNRMVSTRDGHVAALLKDGSVLISGGSDGSKILSSAEALVLAP
jgi:hypothetical protein